MKHTIRKGTVEMKGGIVPRNILAIPVLDTDPTSPVIGQIWINSQEVRLKIKVSEEFTFETPLENP